MTNPKTVIDLHTWWLGELKKMFAEYRKLPKSERPKNDYEKRLQWAQCFSRIVGEDLCPLFNRLRNPDEPEFKLK